METQIKSYSLFFLYILHFSSSVKGEDNSLINDDLRGVLYKIGDDLETKSYNKDEYYNACTYNNGKDPKIRKNIEEIIKVLVKDSLPLAMENLDEQEHDIARDIQVAANEIIIELALHASKITQKILQSMKRTNNTQVAIETEMQHCTLIENQNTFKEVQKLADKMSLVANNTKELAETVNVNNKQQSKSMAIMNNTISLLGNLTSSGSHDMDVLATTVTTEKILKSTMKPFEQKTLSQILSEENFTKVTSLCALKVPASIVTKPEIWKSRYIPEMDDLDFYMINKTGCSYAAAAFNTDHVFAQVSFTGQLEWRVAVRAREHTAMRLWWDTVYIKYSFNVGERSNTVSLLLDFEHDEFSERATPGALAEARYVPLYIKINNGKLTAGAECEPEPWFTANFTAKIGQGLRRGMLSHSRYNGAKFLYDCPTSFTGQ